MDFSSILTFANVQIVLRRLACVSIAWIHSFSVRTYNFVVEAETKVDVVHFCTFWAWNVLKGVANGKSETKRDGETGVFLCEPETFYLLKCEIEINSHYNDFEEIRDSETLTSAQKSRLRDPKKFKVHKNFARPVFLKGPFTTPS